MLGLGEQGRAGEQGTTCPVQGVTTAPAPVVKLLLDSPPALIHSVCGQAYHVERIHDGPGVGKFFTGSGFEPAKPVHRDNLDSLTPPVGLAGKPLFERLLGTARDHVQQSRRASLIVDGGQVDDDRDVPVLAPGMAPYVLIDPDHPHPVKTTLIIKQEPPAFSKNSRVSRMPGHPQATSDMRDTQTPDHDRFQRPSQRFARQTRTRSSC